MEKAIEIASDYSIDLSSPRTAGRQQHHQNIPVDTPSAYWKRAIYLPFLDHLVTEINEKLMVLLLGLQAQLLIPEIARDALLKTGIYTVVQGILSPVNDGYKKKGLIESEHRIQMCRLGVQTSDWISVDNWESEQAGWTRTAKVVKHVAEDVVTKFPGSSPPTVKLLCGADWLEALAEPNIWADEDIEEIVGKHGLVVISRVGFNPESFIYESDVLTKYINNIHIVTDWISNDVSSTKVRRALRRSESVKYLIPDPVIDYIKENKLYFPTK